MSFQVHMLKWYLEDLLSGDPSKSITLFNKCLAIPAIAEQACDIVRGARNLAIYDRRVRMEIANHLTDLWRTQHGRQAKSLDRPSTGTGRTQKAPKSGKGQTKAV